jgi:hypothetical protein
MLTFSSTRKHLIWKSQDLLYSQLLSRYCYLCHLQLLAGSSLNGPPAITAFLPPDKARHPQNPILDCCNWMLDVEIDARLHTSCFQYPRDYITQTLRQSCLASPCHYSFHRHDRQRVTVLIIRFFFVVLGLRDSLYICGMLAFWWHCFMSKGMRGDWWQTCSCVISQENMTRPGPTPWRF